jgi:hypothetical protein
MAMLQLAPPGRFRGSSSYSSLTADKVARELDFAADEVADDNDPLDVDEDDGAEVIRQKKMMCQPASL